MGDQPWGRRQFLTSIGAGAAVIACGGAMGRADVEANDQPHVSINQWSVCAIRSRDSKRADIPFADELTGLAAAGFNGLEPGIQTADQIAPLAAQLAKHGLEMRSIYTGSELVEPAVLDQELERIVALAKQAQAVGTKIIVTNPSPLPDPRGKSDAQLRQQATGLNRVGKELAALGLTLAYHNHDVELAHAAREFHHMMLGTDPQYLSLCLDAHWVYRGAGHSQVALFDVVKLYGPRVVELHLRQSQDHVWSESFGEGDIDYRALQDTLDALGLKPLLVLEQGPETNTPQTRSVSEVHRASCRYAKDLFASS